jgi:alpha-L-fucosidase
MKYNYLIVSFLLVLMTIGCKETDKKADKDSKAYVNYLEESEKDFDKRMEWWRNDRFGMFIHWGVYAELAGVYDGKEIPGIGEWIMRRGQIPITVYEEVARQFNPTKFDADSWVELMKEAGMKYLVITSKHHDGFALWDSEISDYSITKFAPYGKDVLKDLSAACKKNGIKFGVYHSILDWHHPDAQAYSYIENDPKKRADNTEHFANYLESYLKVHVRELIETYDPEIMWFDGEWVGEFSHEQGMELYQYVRSLKPSILINNRVDKGRAGMQGMNKEGNFAGDFGTPEQEILEQASVLDWESCMTMNDTWGFKKNDHNWKSVTTLIHNLVDIVAKGGNYLLNVGPTAEGLIPEPSVERLKAIGSWLEVNGDAIYHTERLEKNYKQGKSIRFTRSKKDNTHYAIIFEKPEAELHIETIIPEKDTKIRLLGNTENLDWTFDESKGLIIELPKTLLDNWSPESHAWTFTIRGTER